MFNPVGLDADGVHLGAQCGEQIGGDVIRRAIRAIEDDAKAGKIQARHCRAAKFGITFRGIVDARSFADAIGRLRWRVRFDFAFDGQFGFVGKFLSVAVKELDAIIPIRIVRSTDDDARAGADLPREKCNGWCRHGAKQTHVGAGGNEASFERRLEHVTGNTRVFADDDGRVMVRHQYATGGASECEHEFRRDRRFAGAAANAVGTEIFFIDHKKRERICVAVDATQNDYIVFVARSELRMPASIDSIFVRAASPSDDSWN